MGYPQNMTTQKPGRDLIQSFEKCQLTSYHNEGEKYYTIGWGHYGKDVVKGMTWTQAKADQVFIQDVIKHEKFKTQVKVPLTQNQFDALSSFSFNLGGLYLQSGEKTTLLIKLNKGDYNGAANEMIKFVFPIQFKDGLTRRRIAEKKLFNTGTSPKAPVVTDKNQDAVNKAKAKKIADDKILNNTKYQKTAEDRRQEMLDAQKVKNAELSKNADAIAKAKATANANANARKKAEEKAKAQKIAKEKADALALKNSYNSNNPSKNSPSSPQDAKAKILPSSIKDISKAKVLKSGISVIGLLAILIIMGNAEIPTTELE